MKDNKTMRIVIFIVVMLIPIIYSFFYLKSYWDPYENLQDMKVAIVNLDEGENGENQGQKVVNKLKDKNVVNICDVSKSEATSGLENEDYYAVITIPENFTKDLNSAGEVDKKVVQITYSPNQKMNYLASQIINKVVTATEEQIKAEVASKTVDTLADNLKEVPESLQKVSDGTEQILNGATNLSNGLNELNNGTNTLKNSYNEFNSGVNSAYQGSRELDNGSTKVNSGIDELQSGANQLNAGIEKINNELDNTDLNKLNLLVLGITELDDGVNGKEGLKNGVDSYVEGTEKLANGVITLDSTLDEEIAKYQAIYTNTSLSIDVRTQAGIALKTLQEVKSEINDTSKGKSLVSGAKELTTKDKTKMTVGDKLKYGASKLSAGATKLNDGIDDIKNLGNSVIELKTNLAKIQSGTGSLVNGITQLKSGSNKLNSGSDSLENGLKTLNASSTQIQSALNTISDGTNSAYNGSIELKNGVNTLKNEVDNGISNSEKELEKLDGLSNHVANPVEVVEKDYGEVTSYGIAFTPLFLSIGLWVGALMCYVVLYYDQKHRFGVLDSDYKNKFKQNALYLGLGAIQGIATALLLKLGLGFEVESMPIFFLVSALMGVCFTAIIQFLIRTFGDVGKFLALIILVLQLAAAGGTFPVDTIDKGFQWLNPLLPMTYTIKLVKDCLISTNVNFLAHNLFIIIAITVVAFICTCGIEIFRKKKEL